MNNGLVGVSALVPLGGFTSVTDFRPVDPVAADVQSVRTQWVNPGYFDILGIPIVAGRNLGPEESNGDAILINETLATRYWPDGHALGRAVRINKRTPVIVGIVRDSHIYGMGAVPPTYFAPFTPSGPWAQPVLIVPDSLASIVVNLVKQQEPLAAVQATKLTDQLDRAIGSTRAAARAAGFLGALALFLTTIGVYGIISYSVEQRRKEIGIRLALGALTGQVIALVLGRNARAALAGLVIGLLGSAAASTAIESQLYGVSRIDPIAYLSVLAILVVAGVAASVIPVLRAARIDAVTTLHHD
jgi:hypothetical protein